jgi:hypothetical protein
MKGLFNNPPYSFNTQIKIFQSKCLGFTIIYILLHSNICIQSLKEFVNFLEKLFVSCKYVLTR